jgi:hypothetical protein
VLVLGPDPGIHGAIDWLLRHGQEGSVPRPLDWGGATALAKIDAELAAPAGVPVPRAAPAGGGCAVRVR